MKSYAIIKICIFLNFVFPSKSPAKANNEIHNVLGCKIYSMEKSIIRAYPGEICIFLDDGSFLASDVNNIKFYDKYNNLIWLKRIMAHHQINLSEDKSKFLVIASENIKLSTNEIVRSDILYVIDMNGEILKKFSLYENRDQFLQKSWKDVFNRKYPQSWNLKRYKEVKWELTHVNSFYELPKNTLQNSLKSFSEGNYIVNDISLMLVFIIDKNFNKILWQSHIKSEDWTMLHDVQVTSKGTILFYDNGTSLSPMSELVEYDVLQNKKVWSYSRNPRSLFYSKRWGGVQFLNNGGVLFSDISTVPRIIEIDKKGKEMWSMDFDKKIYLQQVKRYNLTGFLENNKGIL